MTTPTPRTDALTKRMAGELDRPMLRQDHFIELCYHARQLERDLAAAQEALKFVERWANHHGVKPTCTAEAALSIIQHYPPILAITRSYADGKVPETRNPWAELKEAQEARERAEARVKSLVLDLSAAVGRYQRAEERVRELENFADLMADEFQRIVVCCESGDTFVASEIIGLCQRAVKTTKQNVPVIVQRDRAEALAESYKADAERWQYWRSHPENWNWSSSSSLYGWKSPTKLDQDTDCLIAAEREPK